MLLKQSVAIRAEPEMPLASWVLQLGVPPTSLSSVSHFPERPHNAYHVLGQKKKYW